jgi:senataxin
MFERMAVAGKPAELLDTQYRMLPELRQFPSEHFYQNKLKDGIRNMKPPPSLEHMTSPSWFFDIKYGREERLKKSYQNEAEAILVVYLAERMLAMGRDLTIGIIAPYKSQIKNIEDQFLKKKLSDQKMDRLKISTVDAFQGQERDVIIMTCVKANDDCNIGFVRDWKRMNVSITRAKYALIVFGNYKTLSVESVWLSYMRHHLRKDCCLSVTDHEEAVLCLNTYVIDNS